MAGKTIYFTKNEIEYLLKVLAEWENCVPESVYSHHFVYGPGTAWHKLYIANANNDK